MSQIIGMGDIRIADMDYGALEYLVRNLQGFDHDKAIRDGLYKGAATLASGGRRRLRQRMKNSKGVTGNLLAAISVRVKKSRPGSMAGFRAKKNSAGGADGFDFDNKKKGQHAWLIDYGTKERERKKDGRPTGRGPALRFWSDTRSEDYPEAMERVYEGVERAVNRINNRN